MEAVAQIIVVVLFIFLIVIFVVLFVFIYLRRQRKNRLEKELLHAQFQQEVVKIRIEIQEQTLKNISQEIHDNIGQVLSLVKLQLSAENPNSEETIVSKMESSRALVSKAISDLRDLSRSMHGDRIAERGLQASLADELKLIQKIGKICTQLNTVGEYYKFDAQKEMILFRIAQEALNNALKYSGAKKLIIQLDYKPEQFVLFVIDDGIGFDLSSVQSGLSGIGLKSMQNRAELIGGKFSLESFPKKGTTVSITLQTGN